MRTGEQHIDTAAWMQAIFNRSEQADTRRERTKQALLRAGIELIAEEQTDLSILAITQKAGVSNGSFYNFFKDRTQFFDAVAEYAAHLRRPGHLGASYAYFRTFHGDAEATIRHRETPLDMPVLAVAPAKAH